MSGIAVAPTVEIRPPRRRRIRKMVTWLVGLALFWLVLQLLGVDVWDWLTQFWAAGKAMPPGYTGAALMLQAGQAFFAGLCYYGILYAADPREVKLGPVVAAYAVGVAM